MEGKTKRKRRRKEQEDQPQSGNTDDARENGNRDSAPGFGRRGTPFDVKWNGESLAAKQFVTNKEDGFSGLRAPESSLGQAGADSPLCVRSFGVVFLGLVATTTFDISTWTSENLETNSVLERSSEW